MREIALEKENETLKTTVVDLQSKLTALTISHQTQTQAMAEMRRDLAKLTQFVVNNSHPSPATPITESNKRQNRGPTPDRNDNSMPPLQPTVHPVHPDPRAPSTRAPTAQNFGLNQILPHDSSKDTEMSELTDSPPAVVNKTHV